MFGSDGEEYEESRCPFGGIAHCPLYIESHNAGGLGCVDDMARKCRVERGEMNLQKQLLLLANKGIDHPGMMQAIRTVGTLQ